MMTPKERGYFMPAEWHDHCACWMAWPCHQKTWEKIGLKKARAAFAHIAHVIAEFEPVNMLVNPEHWGSALTMCSKKINLHPLAIVDSWTRDTGPTFLINEQGHLAGVDWIHNAWGNNYSAYDLDNLIAPFIIKQTNADYFKAPLVMEGGSFHVDGEGTVLTTKECLLNPNRNPKLNQNDIETYLRHYLNCEKIIWLNKGLIGDETDGHIDEIACFTAPGKVLALITHDKQDPNYSILQENYEHLKSQTDAKGRILEINTVEQPPATFLNNERLTLSYINFYLANNGLVMPSFGYADYDKDAYQTLSHHFPDRNIIQVDALDIFAGGGGIHCITQQQPSTIGTLG